MSALDKQEGGSHYKDLPIQPVEFITKNKLGFLEGCVIKRVCRWRAKNGIEDLRKAIHELELLIEMEEKLGPAVARVILTPAEVEELAHMAKKSGRGTLTRTSEGANPREIHVEPSRQTPPDGYYLAPGIDPATIPSNLADGTIVFEWGTGASHTRIGVMHRGQLVRDPAAG